MKLTSKMFVLMVVSAGLILGTSGMGYGAAKELPCFLLLYHDCFKDFNFKPDKKTWSRSAVVFNNETFGYFRRDIELSSASTKVGAWFRWTRSLFMHQICESFVPPDLCSTEKGLPVYAGSLVGGEDPNNPGKPGVLTRAKGYGFMTKTTGTYEWPVCWYMEPISKDLKGYCPQPTASDGSDEAAAAIEYDEETGENESVLFEEEVEAKFIEMRDQWLETFDIKE